jgi:hypothetical protein
MKYYRPRDYLYSFEPPAETRLLLSNVLIERVLGMEKDSIWVITAGANRKLCKISKTGTMEEIVGVDDHWVAPEIHYSFSRGGKYLALSALHDQHDFHKERELIVINLQSKRINPFKERVSGSMFPTTEFRPI